MAAVGAKRTWTDEDLIRACDGARSVREILERLGLAINGGNAGTIKKYLSELDLEVPRVKAKSPAQRAKEYRERHPDRVKASFQDYQKKNLDKFAQYARNRGALRSGAEGSFTLDEFEQLCKSYGNRCLACGSLENLSADHVIPLSKGGSNSIENIQPLCVSCNCKKNDKHIDYRRTNK